MLTAQVSRRFALGILQSWFRRALGVLRTACRDASEVYGLTTTLPRACGGHDHPPWGVSRAGKKTQRLRVPIKTQPPLLSKAHTTYHRAAPHVRRAHATMFVPRRSNPQKPRREKNGSTPRLLLSALEHVPVDGAVTQFFEGLVGLLEALGADERVRFPRRRQRGRVGAGDNPVLRRVDQCALFLRIRRGARPTKERGGQGVGGS